MLVAPALPSSDTMLLGMFGSPVFAIVRLLNVVEFRPLIVWLFAPLKLTVFDPAVNVPLLIQFPPSLMSAPGA